MQWRIWRIINEAIKGGESWYTAWQAIKSELEKHWPGLIGLAAAVLVFERAKGKHWLNWDNCSFAAGVVASKSCARTSHHTIDLILRFVVAHTSFTQSWLGIDNN